MEDLTLPGHPGKAVARLPAPGRVSSPDNKLVKRGPRCSPAAAFPERGHQGAWT